MELLKSGFKSVLGGQQQQVADYQATGAETVERLVDRVQSSTLLEDRRDAVRALKSLSKKFRLEVGAQAMDALTYVLEKDRADSEIVGYALDTLCNVVSPDPPDLEDGEVAPPSVGDGLGTQFTEIFIKRTENVTLLLELLEEYDFHVRWPAVKLLTCLLYNKPREIQECVLVSPMGVSKLMDLLSDSREVIRNDTLLLLIQLTKNNANIQKIVAFENAFDRLLDIITEEGGNDGGIVVEDCLMLLLNLLKNNSSNQNFFKEGSFIQRLAPFFVLTSAAENDTSDTGWSAQKVSNIHLMLQLVRTLVSPNNPVQSTATSQKVMSACGLLERLCNILMESGVPADILTEAINTVAEVIRGHHSNQEYFAGVLAPCNPPRPAIVVLLMSMVNEKQPFVLRCSVLYCFQSFLYRNELGQAQIIQTLLPTSADVSSITAGQLLCGGLFSADSLSNWFASVALSHALVDNPSQKEQLLRVQLATSLGNPPVSLMFQVSNMLQQAPKPQTRLGLLVLITTWLSGCYAAVSHFLNIPTNVPYLISQASLSEGDDQETLLQGLCAFVLGVCIQFNDDSVPSFNRESLCQLIEKRIGLEAFFDKINAVMKHEAYSRAAQRPQLKYRNSSEVIFDYEFCRLYKSLEGSVINAASPNPRTALLNGPESHLTESEHSLLQQYKELIREQDQQIMELKSRLEDVQSEYSKSSSQVTEMSSLVQQLRDQNALLKAQQIGENLYPVAVKANPLPVSCSGNQLLDICGITLPTNEVSANQNTSSTDIDKLQQQISDLQLQLQQKNNFSCSDTMAIPSESVQLEAELSNMRATIGQYIERIHYLEEENDRLSENQNTGLLEVVSHSEPSYPVDISEFQESLNSANQQIQQLLTEKTELERSAAELADQLSKVNQEQDDLLVLLTEQETKINNQRQRLRELGEKVSDEEIDEEDLLDDDDDDVDHRD